MKRCMLAVLIVLFLASACAGHTADTVSEPELALFLVKGELPEDAGSIDLGALTLEDEPVLTDGDIVLYYWDEQMLVTPKDLLWDRFKERLSVSGIPFVAVVGGERVYLGYFWTSLSSLWPRYPCIFMDGTVGIDTDQNDVGEDETLYALQWDESDAEMADCVFDQRIHDALEQKGLLK